MADDINATDPIFEWARRAPYAVAVLEDGRVVRYRTLRSAVLRAMAAFRAAGWQPGEVVAISLSEGYALQLAVSIALARAGLAQVWLSPKDPPEYRAARARALGVAALIADEPGRLDGIRCLAPEAGWLSDAGAGSAPADLRVDASGRTMILIQSSGTTGTPKDIAVSHAEELLYAQRNGASSACLPGERCLIFTGLRFWTGLTRALRCLGNGGALVAPPERWTADGLLRLVALLGITYLWCAPVQVQNLLGQIRDASPQLPHLRFFRCSSGALPRSSVLEAKRRISPNLSIQYGSNETGGITAAPPELVERYPDCAGLPLPGVDLQIVDDDDRPVAPGAVGHVRVRGAGIGAERMRGASQGTPAYRGEWFYPGDLGLRNEEGVVFLKGRSDEVMNFDGIMIGPADIETVLGRHPAVKDAAAFPLPSVEHESIPAAGVVLKSAVSVPELLAYCRGHLGNRAPHRIFIVDAIPRSPIGKILRRRLTEAAVAQEARGPGGET